MIFEHIDILSKERIMENVTINKNAEKQEPLNNRITIENRNKISISGITQMISSNDTSITMLVKNTKLMVTGKELHIEKLDVENGNLEASGNIDIVKYSGGEGLVKRIFK